MIEILKFEEDILYVLDQTLLPWEEKWFEIRNVDDGVKAIKEMKIRGAPLIGVVAAYTISIEARKGGDMYKVFEKLKYSRPTAFNLFYVIERAKILYEKEGKEALYNFGEQIHKEEIERSEKIIENGLKVFPTNREINVMTYCNTGVLATGAKGTALGVIIEAYKRGLVKTVYVPETRPVLQGARLTTYELHKENVHFILITDNEAVWLMKRGKIEMVMVGADRIAANYDTANKIGTLTLALGAKEYGIPFFIVAPTSTIDPSIKDGEHIPIELRKKNEIFNLYTLPFEVDALNYAFDVTPKKYIKAIITEEGIIWL